MWPLVSIAVLSLQAVGDRPEPKQSETEITLRRVAKHFEALEWQPPADFGGGLCRYRLHIPPCSRENHERRRWPLLVWIHGGGPSGTDNISQLSGLELVLPLDSMGEAPEMFILAPQRPKEAPWATPDQPDKRSSLAMLDGLLRHVLETYPIDPDRVYLTGLCEGGTACLDFARQYPGYFAAMAPMHAVAGDPSWAPRLTGIPIWTFFAINTDGPPDDAQRMVNAIQAAGGTAWLSLTMLKLADIHDCWTAAFEEYSVVDWLLAQRRGGFVWWRPGWLWYVPEWEWWQIPAWLCVGLFVRFTWRQERKGQRLRKRRRHQAREPAAARLEDKTVTHA